MQLQDSQSRGKYAFAFAAALTGMGSDASWLDVRELLKLYAIYSAGAELHDKHVCLMFME